LNKITQRIPGFNWSYFDTTDELLNLPWVKDYENLEGRVFSRFSVRDHWLICEYDEGAWWQTVGFIWDCKDRKITLPKWDFKSQAATA
jgi:hypothetical protein